MEAAGTHEAFAGKTVFLSFSKTYRTAASPARGFVRAPESCCRRGKRVAGAASFMDIARRSPGDRPVRRKVARTLAPVPAFSRRHARAGSPRRYFRHPRRGGIPGLLHRMRRGAGQDARGWDRHRPSASLGTRGKTLRRSSQKRPRKRPHGPGLRRAPAPRARASFDEPRIAARGTKIERDRRHPGLAREEGDRGRRHPSRRQIR